MIDYDLAIKDVTLYQTRVVSIRDALNEGKTISLDQRTNLQRDYEILVRPHADAVEMHEPGEQEWHGYILKFDNPVEWAVKEGSFFSLNNTIAFLNRLVGRLEYYKIHPEQFLSTQGKLSSETALLRIQQAIHMFNTSAKVLAERRRVRLPFLLRTNMMSKIFYIVF